jgi:hypothetical protein
MLLDAEQIHMIRDVRDDPEMMCGLDEPSTPGAWGDYTVGGEPLHSPEVWRTCWTTCSFCFEDLAEIKQRPHNETWGHKYKEWREVDNLTLSTRAPQKTKIQKRVS